MRRRLRSFERRWRAGHTNPGFGFVGTDRSGRKARSRSKTPVFNDDCLLSSFEGISLQKNSLVAMAKRSHPFPYRTRKLSSLAPMVVGGSPPVRVGRCQALRRASNLGVLFFLDK